MNLLVGALDDHLAKREERTDIAKLAEFTVSDDASELYLQDNVLSTKSWALDETANAALTRYLKVPTGYYEKLTPDFRAQVLRYELHRHHEAVTAVETLNDELIAVHSPDQIMLPMHRVAGVVTTVFDESDTIRRIITNDQRFHLDVTTAKHAVSFPANTPELLTALNGGTHVGDITEAGVRILAYPFRNTRPSVNAYAERLVCMNGQTTPESLGTINLKGNTVDEVINAMEEAAQAVLGTLDAKLTDLAATRGMYTPGSPQAFAAQLCREANLPRKVLDKILDIINQLPEPVSIWDVNQAFTNVANSALTYNAMVKLQTVGGELGFNAEKAVARCGTCEQKL